MFVKTAEAKKFNIFSLVLLTLRNMLSILDIANNVKLFADNRISVVRHGNGVPARANRNAARKFSDNKQENDIQMTKGGIRMEPKFLRAEEVAQELSVKILA